MRRIASIGFLSNNLKKLNIVQIKVTLFSWMFLEYLNTIQAIFRYTKIIFPKKTTPKITHLTREMEYTTKLLENGVFKTLRLYPIFLTGEIYLNSPFLFHYFQWYMVCVCVCQNLWFDSFYINFFLNKSFSKMLHITQWINNSDFLHSECKIYGGFLSVSTCSINYIRQINISTGYRIEEWRR